MSYLIDEVARTLASPVSRRVAFKRIRNLAVGAVFLGVRQVARADSCSSCCANSKNCNFGGRINVCCNSSKGLCCKVGCCTARTQTCVTSAGC